MARRLPLLGAFLIVAVVLAGGASGRALHFPVNVSVTGPGHVSGSGDGGSIDCPPTCSAMILQQSSISLYAQADSGASFEGWGGDCSGAGVCTLVMDGDRSVSASFSSGTAPPPPPPPATTPPPPPPPPAPPSFALTVAKNGSGSGYVGGAGGIDCGVTCTASFNSGTQVTLIAAPGTNSRFTGWSGACAGRSPSCRLTVAADTSVTATFTALDRTAPKVRALRSAGKPGQKIKLRYTASDNSGSSKTRLTVMQGKRVLATITTKMARVRPGRVYVADWRAPRSLEPREQRKLCVRGTDPSGNQSRLNCAPLVIR
jgi:hypothetical protein